jgi:beta-glucanase (GH16 family)
MNKCILKLLALGGLFAVNSVFIWSAFPQSAQAESFSLVWSTNFNSPLNSSGWNVYNNAPFGSSANACFVASNASAQNKLLKLSINQNTNGCDRPYSSSGLDTYFAHAQNYGRWTVRAKFPKGKGVVGYIGLFVADGSSWPPEIDFAEVLGRDPKTLYLTQHYALDRDDQKDKNDKDDQKDKNDKDNQKDGSHQQDGLAVIQSGVNWTAGYHTYTLEWVPGKLRYYVDGVLRLTQNQNFEAPSARMKLAMGTGTGNCGSWVDCPTSRLKSSKMSVQFVKIYQYNP